MSVIVPESKTKADDTCDGKKKKPVIVPKSKTKGVDICDGNVIIRSDVEYYMTTHNLYTRQSIEIHRLHRSCKDGDHYLCDKEKYYIIKGDSYRTVNDLADDSDPPVYDLHPNCKGGDHYLFHDKKFNIIFQEKGVFRQTSDLKTDKDGVEKELHPKFRKGLYYWNSLDGISMLKPTDKCGVQIYKMTSLDKEDSNSLLVHPDVLNFLPGGLAVTHGPAFRKWERIESKENDSNAPLEWEKKIKKKVGYKKSKSSRIEHKWKVSGNTTGEAPKLVQLIVKLQFSLSAEYGGQSLNTENENWEEETEVEETLKMTIQPKTNLYVWQYKLGFGKEDVLFCRDLRFSNDPNPPADTALKVLELLKKDNSE